MLVVWWRVFEGDGRGFVNSDVAFKFGCIGLVECEVWSEGGEMLHDMLREMDCVRDGGGMGGKLP